MMTKSTTYANLVDVLLVDNFKLLLLNLEIHVILNHLIKTSIEVLFAFVCTVSRAIRRLG